MSQLYYRVAACCHLMLKYVLRLFLKFRHLNVIMTIYQCHNRMKSKPFLPCCYYKVPVSHSCTVKYVKSNL